MDALSATQHAVTAAAPVPAVRIEPEPAAVPQPAQQATVAESLPALPAAVQRAQLETPPPKLITREQMAALLALTT